MKRGRILTLLTTVLLAVPGFGAARAEQPEMQIGISGGEVLPGSASVITVTVPALPHRNPGRGRGADRRCGGEPAGFRGI